MVLGPGVGEGNFCHGCPHPIGQNKVTRPAIQPQGRLGNAVCSWKAKYQGKGRMDYDSCFSPTQVSILELLIIRQIFINA